MVTSPAMTAASRRVWGAAFTSIPVPNASGPDEFSCTKATLPDA